MLKIAREVVVLVVIGNVALYLNDCTRLLLHDRQGPCASALCSWKTALM